MESKVPLKGVSELQGTLHRAYEKIEDEEISNGLGFFRTTGADDEEFDEWDANDLDDFPRIKDFVEDFEPYSPYDEDRILNVEFVDPHE